MNITQLLQKAIVAFLDAQSLTTVENIYHGIEGGDTAASGAEEDKMELPCVVVDTGSAEPNVLFSGNWKVPAFVRVRTQADDETQTNHHTRAQEVFGKISTSTIAADLSGAQANFTAFLVIPIQAQAEPSDRHWESVLAMDVICCPSDIS